MGEERVSTGGPVRLRGLGRASAAHLADAGGSIWKAAPWLISTATRWYAPVLIVAWLLATWSPWAGLGVAVVGTIPAHTVLSAYALDVALGGVGEPGAARRSARAAAPAIAGQCLQFVVLSIVTFGVAAPLLIPRYLLVAPVAVGEGTAVGRRSRALVRDHRVRALNAAFLSAVPGVVLAVSATGCLVAAADLVDAPIASSYMTPSIAILTSISVVLVLPWIACTGVVLYLAGRQRSEQLDLWMQIQRLPTSVAP